MDSKRTASPNLLLSDAGTSKKVGLFWSECLLLHSNSRESHFHGALSQDAALAMHIHHGIIFLRIKTTFAGGRGCEIS